MFSYRHAYHAGNHADLLKHLTLCSVLHALQQKDTALSLIDTHAGCGLYTLSSAQSQRSGEAQQGVHRLLAACEQARAASHPLAPAVARYVEALLHTPSDNRSQSGLLRTYPGSPALMWQALRAQDQMHCFELLAADARELQRQLQHCQQTRYSTASDDAQAMTQAPLQVQDQTNTSANDNHKNNASEHQHASHPNTSAPSRKKWQVHISNGFEGLRALLPPPSRRALVLIDPSYEIKTDYAAVLATVKDALQRFATGCYAVWLPEIPRIEAHTLPRKLRTLANQNGKSYLCATLRLPHDPTAPAGKLQGSSICLINPPFTLAQELKEALPFLAQALGHRKHSAQAPGWELDVALV